MSGLTTTKKLRAYSTPVYDLVNQNMVHITIYGFNTKDWRKIFEVFNAHFKNLRMYKFVDSRIAIHVPSKCKDVNNIVAEQIDLILNDKEDKTYDLFRS